MLLCNGNGILVHRARWDPIFGSLVLFRVISSAIRPKCHQRCDQHGKFDLFRQSCHYAVLQLDVRTYEAIVDIATAPYHQEEYQELLLVPCHAIRPSGWYFPFSNLSDWSVLLFVYSVVPASDPQHTSPFRILPISNCLWIGFAASGGIGISCLLSVLSNITAQIPG